MKSKKVIKKPVKKIINKKVSKKKEVCNCCRQPSDKSKDSKVQKLKRMASKPHGHPEKKGFFGKLFGK